LNIERTGDEVTAVVDVSGVGFANQATLRPSYNTATRQRGAMPALPKSRFMLVVQELNPDGSVLLNMQAPGNQSQLGNVATRTTFLASLLGFTGLFWWVFRLRATILGLRRQVFVEGWA